VCVSNFAALPHSDFRLGLPAAGDWREVVNTDASTYTGSGVGNLGVVAAHEGAEGGQPAHATLVLPPLATIWLRRD
jgi:1,4-alpha-glucan branching enzyme